MDEFESPGHTGRPQSARRKTDMDQVKAFSFRKVTVQAPHLSGACARPGRATSF